MTITGKNFSYTRGVGLIHITEPTTFEDCNFSQQFPHTEIFSNPDNHALTFVRCNLVNVAVPEAIVDGGNLTHGWHVNVPDPLPEGKTKVRLLCACDKCAPAREVIQRMVRSKGQIGFTGKRWQHDMLKVMIRARRQQPGLVAVDMAASRTDNRIALRRLSASPNVPDDVLDALIPYPEN